MNDRIVVVYNKLTNDIIEKFHISGAGYIDIDDTLKRRCEHDPYYAQYCYENIAYTFTEETDMNMIPYESGKVGINPNTGEVSILYTIDKHFQMFVSRQPYNQMSIQREFTSDDVYKMYNTDYINFNLKQAIKCGLFKASFIPLNQIHVRPLMLEKSWKFFYTDPFLTECADDKLKLARSIVKDGTYWPFLVNSLDVTTNDLYIFEGNHRITSLKLLSYAGEIPKDYKVFCIKFPHNFDFVKSEYKNVDFENLKPQYRNINRLYPQEYRYVVEMVYSDKFFTDSAYHDRIETFINAHDKRLSEYTYQTTANTIWDSISALRDYPLFLRDLLYNYPEVRPSRIINDENAYKSWIEEG